MIYKRIIVAGAELAAALDAERNAVVPKNAWGFSSEELCALQIKRSARGICEIEIVESAYGYSVRYASGLQNFGLLRASRGRPEAERTLEAAEQFCRDWVAQAPAVRFATRSITEPETVNAI